MMRWLDGIWNMEVWYSYQSFCYDIILRSMCYCLVVALISFSNSSTMRQNLSEFLVLDHPIYSGQNIGGYCAQPKPRRQRYFIRFLTHDSRHKATVSKWNHKISRAFGTPKTVTKWNLYGTWQVTVIKLKSGLWLMDRGHEVELNCQYYWRKSFLWQ